MNRDGFRNLTLFARIAYVIMCFERYTGFVYSDVDFTPAAEMLWHMVDGSEASDLAALKLEDMIPDHLFSHQSYAAYQENGNACLTVEEFSMLRRILNSYDWSLNSMLKQMYQIMTEYADGDVTPGAPETLPYLVNVTSILKTRSIGLPDTELLRQYAVIQEEMSADEEDDWRGGPIDPAPLSLLGITGTATAPMERSTKQAESMGYQSKDISSGFSKKDETCYAANKSVFSKDEIEASAPVPEEFTRPSEESNGCTWEYFEDTDGCILTRCINSNFLKEVTIPSELNGKPVIEIDNNAFSSNPDYGCLMIEKLTMPDTVRRIGDCFFKGCASLRQITFSSNLESIGHEAFRGASRLETIRIGDRCQVIGDYFCADAVSLRTVRIGAGIEYIGEYTFYNTPAMTDFHCDGMLSELGYGSFWVNRWADKVLFHPTTELLRFCKDNALLYRYVKRNPPPRLFFDEGIRYVYDFAFGGDAWHSGDGIRDIYFPGAEKIGVQAFRKTPHATVHLSASRMQAAYGPDYDYTLRAICEPAKVVFDLP
ncbi:MAG: leucine-rich repeat domain-containing protein [Oscillospiraceae bacterium]|nr:leucine-rich repeat domain-containing protein [Oscillospiraceae bacterium]